MTSARSLSIAERTALEQKIASLEPWFHNFEIARDVWTNPHDKGPGSDYPARRWQYVEELFRDVKGKKCLDVGCSSGFFSLKAKELGADFVLGVDQGEQNRALDQARFAADVLGLAVTFQATSAYDLPQIGNRFDTVFFMGVFYHLRHPMLALEGIRAVCGSSMIFQTITAPTRKPPRELDASRTHNVELNSPVMLDENFPALRFIEGQLAGDGSCWFIPNVAAVFAMLRSCGFKPETVIYPGPQEIIVRCAVV
jgi:tRNA (mo5U34)-methyltransferase